MGVRRTLVQNLEKPVGTLISTVRYKFDLSIPQYDVGFHVHYRQDIAENELIFKLSLCADSGGLDMIDTSNISWAYSRVAASAYAYSPAGEAGTIVTLKPLRSTVPIAAAIIEPVRWRGLGSSPSKIIGDVFAIHPNRAFGTVSVVSLGEVVVPASKELVAL